MEKPKEFKETIKEYLDKRVQEDELFTVSYTKENKNIDDCCAYITTQARKQANKGCAVISDDVVFNWAVHYYDENDIKIEKSSNIRSEVKVSTLKTGAKEEIPKTKIKPKKKENINQLSLF